MALLAYGINHKTAPLSLREQLALPENNLQSPLQSLVNDYEKLENDLLDNPNVTINNLAERRKERNEARKLIAKTRPRR